MDSHTFSDPILVAPRTWQVNVLRGSGGDKQQQQQQQEQQQELVVVGTLRIHPDNFPPRRKNNNNKILWQLPTNDQQIPRFGTHEKARLWELYKQQRKERRKKAAAQNRSKQKTTADGSSNKETTVQELQHDDSNRSNIVPNNIDNETGGERDASREETSTCTVITTTSSRSDTEEEETNPTSQAASRQPLNNHQYQATTSVDSSISSMPCSLPPPPPGFAYSPPGFARSPAISPTPPPTAVCSSFPCPPDPSHIARVFATTALVEPQQWLSHYKDGVTSTVVLGAAPPVRQPATRLWSDLANTTSHSSNSPTAVGMDTNNRIVVLTGTLQSHPAGQILGYSLTLVLEHDCKGTMRVAEEVLTLFG